MKKLKCWKKHNFIPGRYHTKGYAEEVGVEKDEGAKRYDLFKLTGQDKGGPGSETILGKFNKKSRGTEEMFKYMRKHDKC